MWRIFGLVVVGSTLLAGGIWLGKQPWLELPDGSTAGEMINPWLGEGDDPTPLNQYSLVNLPGYPFAASQIKVGEASQVADGYVEYPFAFTTMGKTMSGLLTAPAAAGAIASNTPVVIMVRGWVPPENYVSGLGSSPAARQLAQNGYVTLAPDFFGLGTSDADFEDTWQGRFIKPINVIELIRSVQANGVTVGDAQISPNPRLGMWGHSNGGQISLSVLEILQEPIPTTVWAPVTAPFPYSILYFGWEEADEGKQQRAWINYFEQDYDVFDFSITQHLDRLMGPLQIHHGSADEAAPQAWSNAFVTLLDSENESRSSSPSATSNGTQRASQPSPPIEYQYFQYPGADHNLRPVENWNQAVARDIEFFNAQLR